MLEWHWFPSETQSRQHEYISHNALHATNCPHLQFKTGLICHIVETDYTCVHERKTQNLALIIYLFSHKSHIHVLSLNRSRVGKNESHRPPTCDSESEISGIFDSDDISDLVKEPSHVVMVVICITVRGSKAPVLVYSAEIEQEEEEAGLTTSS